MRYVFCFCQFFVRMFLKKIRMRIIFTYGFNCSGVVFIGIGVVFYVVFF